MTRTPTVYPGGMKIWGIDWSGAKAAGKKVWIADATCRKGQLTINTVVQAASKEGIGAKTADEVLDKLVATLSGPDAPDWVGIDCAFSLPQETMKRLKPDTWEGLIAAVGPDYETPTELRNACREDLKEGAKEEKRDIDIAALTAWSPYNLRMVAQTFHGMRLLHRLREGRVASILPFDAVSNEKPNVLEICPGTSLEAAGLSGIRYKAGSRKTNPGRHRAREIVMGRISKVWDVHISADLYQLAVNDTEGDAVDAILAAISTAFDAALKTPEWHAQTRAKTSEMKLRGEGWVYSDPWDPTRTAS